MTITSTVAIDLVDRDRYPLAQVYAKQDDSLSRAIAASIYAAGVAWVPPSGATAVIRYRRPDGIGGIYDELPDGSVAYTIADNVITAYIAPDALSCPGRVRMDIVIVNGTEALATFDISVLVDAAPTSGVAPTNGYYKYKTLADINAALAARVQSVNNQAPDNKGNVQINAEQTGAVSRTAFDAAMTTVVRKVNGVTPDSDGNVNVSAESGGNVLSVNSQTGAVQIPTPASGVCSIGADIPAKVVESVSPGASPTHGALVYVKFEAANTAENPTLTFMGYTAPIVDGDGNAVAPGALTAGTHGFQRRGETWVLLDGSGAAGEDGGYYAPSVDSGGNLTWTASRAGMPQVSGANIKGPPGADGKSAYQYAVEGGYTGTEAEFAAKMAAEIPEVDDTLTKSGQAADSAVVGNLLSSLSEEKVALPTDADGNTILGTAGWYAVSDGAGGITWVESAPSTGGGGETTTHGIIWDLVNVASSNAVASVNDGASLTAVLTPAEGYTLGDVTVTMGGEALTGAWNADTATVSIQSVTGDVIISCAGVVVSTEEEIANTWGAGIWKYDTTTETWAVDTGTMTRCCIRQQIDATDGYLKIRFNRQDSYDQYMSDPATDCPMVQAVVASGIVNLATTKLSNLGNAALLEVTGNKWQKIEWDTDYYLPSGYIYRIQAGRNINPYVLDEDSFAFTKFVTTLTLGSSNKNMASIVTTDGFCMITKITGGSISTEASVASSVDAQYTQELGISTTYLVPDDVESEPTTYTGAIKKAISEWMIAYKGDTRKIPVIIHTDQHGRLTSASKSIFTALGNLIPWYDVSKIMNLGDCVGDHWEDSDTANPFLACRALETMMDCLTDIPISKRLDVFGNHDTWYHDIDGNDVVVPDQARLSQYFRNIFARNPNSNQQGYFVDYDNKYNVKYVVVSGFEYTTSRSTYRISTAQMKWLIGEMSKDDGYDIVVVSHIPLYYQPSTEVYPTGMTPSDEGSTVVSRLSNVDTDTLFNARKNKTSGTVTDSDGVEHTFDFSGCTTDILCGLHGHIHMDGYNYVGSSGLVSVTFDWFADNTMHFVLVDRVNRQLNVWKVDSTNTVQNYQVPLDNATE